MWIKSEREKEKIDERASNVLRIKVLKRQCRVATSVNFFPSFGPWCQNGPLFLLFRIKRERRRRRLSLSLLSLSLGKYMALVINQQLL